MSVAALKLCLELGMVDLLTLADEAPGPPFLL